MQDPEITTEPVIGRHVAAKRVPPSPLRQQIDDLADRLNISPMHEQPVKIEVGDVDWDTVDTLVVDDDALREIAYHYYGKALEDPVYFESEDGNIHGSTSSGEHFFEIVEAVDEDQVLRVATDPDNLEDDGND